MKQLFTEILKGFYNWQGWVSILCMYLGVMGIIILATKVNGGKKIFNRDGKLDGREKAFLKSVG